MHDILDAISLEMARRVAARLRADPQLLDVARRNLARWTSRNADTPSLMRCYREWEALLEKPIEEICDVLCMEGDEGQRLRQNSPFVGVLPQDEVWELKKKFRKGEAARP